MKNFFLHHINHACIEIFTPYSKIITDPWIDGFSWADQLKLKTESSEPKNNYYDYVFVSHSHSDHWHESIKLIEDRIKNSTFLVPIFGKDNYMFKNIRSKFSNKVIEFKGEYGELTLNKNQKLFYAIDLKEHDCSILIKTESFPDIYLQTDNLMKVKRDKLINVKSKTSLGFYIKKTTGIYPRFISSNEFNKSIKSSLELEISKDTNFIENQIKHIKEIDTKHNFLYASSIDYTRKINYKYPAISDQDIVNQFKKNGISVNIIKPGDIILADGNFYNDFIKINKNYNSDKKTEVKIETNIFLENLIIFFNDKIHKLNNKYKFNKERILSKFDFEISIFQNSIKIDRKIVKGNTYLDGSKDLIEMRFDLTALESILQNKWNYPSLRELTNGGLSIIRKKQEVQEEFEKILLESMYLPNFKFFINK